MINDQSQNESILPSSKNIPNISEEISRIYLRNDYISVEQDDIDFLLSQVLIDPFESVKKLREISDRQYISIPNDYIPYLMTVLSNALSTDIDENDEETILLRKNVFQLLENIAGKSTGEDQNFYELLSDPTYLSTLWKGFPEDNYSTRLLAKIVAKIPDAAQYIIEHEINDQQLSLLMSKDNPQNIIENVLRFFSSAFSKIGNFIPDIMNPFIDFACDIILDYMSKIENEEEDDDYIDLIEELKEALEKMVKSFEEVAKKIVPFLPKICVFNEISSSSIMNVSTNSLLTESVEKLNTYTILFNEDPEKVIYFISRCFDRYDSNDCSLFSVLKLLTVLEDLSPFDDDIEIAAMLFEKLVAVIINNEKYDLKEYAVLSACRLINNGSKEEVQSFLELVDFSIIFEFLEYENIGLQKELLEAILHIGSFQSNEEFIPELISNEMQMQTIDNLTKSKDEKISEYANLIIEKGNS